MTEQKQILIISNDSINSNTVNSKKNKFSLAQTLLTQIIISLDRFNYVSLGQWIILVLLNAICLSFLIFACFYVVD